MKKLILGISICISALSPAVAQRSELGVLVGGAFYLGDINPSGLFSQTKLVVGGVYRYNLNTRWAIRGNALWGTVTGDDEKLKNPRNLNFRSRISEFSLQAELSFLPYFTGSNRNYRFSPYIFGGVALFAFNPQAYYYDDGARTGRWVDLAPLHTEGQGLSAYPDKKTYNTTQVSLPFGLGFKYSLNSKFCIGLEWGMRKTFTDYLDDVSGTYADRAILASQVGWMSGYLSDRSEITNPIGSARGNSNKTDWYSFAGVTLTVKLGKGRPEPCASYKSSAMERIKRSEK